ncbi:MAG: bifunctional DNA primase/polymerase [Caulobacteraceae bacterium]
MSPEPRVLVVDVDAHVGSADGLATLAALETEHGPLPATWRTRTPSGGLHLWFGQPFRPLRNKVGFLPGLDVRTDGGSVAVPPSIRRGTKVDGRYTWIVAPWDRTLADAPAWLLDLIDPPPVPRPAPRAVRFASHDRAARYVAAVIDGECGELAATKTGGRNHRLFQAAARIGEIVGAGLCGEALAIDALESAAADCGLVAEDGRQAVLASIKSGLARGAANPREVRL